MARGVAERINAPVLDKLKPVHRTRAQVELSAEARRTNVASAYASTRGFGAGKILLVDVVFATGATWSGCAEASRYAGGGEVQALTLYRTCWGVFKPLRPSVDQEN